MSDTQPLRTGILCSSLSGNVLALSEVWFSTSRDIQPVLVPRSLSEEQKLPGTQTLSRRKLNHTGAFRAPKLVLSNTCRKITVRSWGKPYDVGKSSPQKKPEQQNQPGWKLWRQSMPAPGLIDFKWSMQGLLCWARARTLWNQCRGPRLDPWSGS